jgi:RNA polymerase primary sigma factor
LDEVLNSPEPFEDEDTAPDAGPFRAERATDDDALTVYLHQMGAIARLSPEEERQLVRRLDHTRRRYRHAALCNWWVLAQVVETFERTRMGRQSLERTIDVVPSLDLTAAHIRTLLPLYLRRLRRWGREAVLSPSRLRQLEASRPRLRRSLHKRLRRAVALAEQLSPRIELVHQWVSELERFAGQLSQRDESSKEHGLLVRQLQTTPRALQRLLAVVRRRRAAYEQTRRDLVERNLRLVIAVAKRYRNFGLPFADLIQEGNSGLLRAVDKFDYRLGYKFGTYATWWIRQGVTRALSDLSRTVRVPSHLVSVLRSIDRVRGELTVRLQREPTIDEIAKRMKTKPAEIRALMEAGRPPASIDEGFGGDEDNTLQNLLRDSEKPDPLEHVDQNLLRDRLEKLLRCLDPRDREVIEMRYGLRDGKARTLKEVAEAFGITRERIRQIESRGLNKLREPERAEQLAPFADTF